MNVAKLSDTCSVASQIQPADVDLLAGQGFATIICNRPDGEDAGQPSSDSIREACEQRGIAFHMIPIQGTVVSPRSVLQFQSAVEHSQGPVLAYCRSGTRSAMLWQIASDHPTPF